MEKYEWKIPCGLWFSRIEGGRSATMISNKPTNFGSFCKWGIDDGIPDGVSNNVELKTFFGAFDAPTPPTDAKWISMIKECSELMKYTRKEIESKYPSLWYSEWPMLGENDVSVGGMFKSATQRFKLPTMRS